MFHSAIISTQLALPFGARLGHGTGTRARSQPPRAARHTPAVDLGLRAAPAPAPRPPLQVLAARQLCLDALLASVWWAERALDLRLF